MNINALAPVETAQLNISHQVGDQNIIGIADLRLVRTIHEMMASEGVRSMETQL